jgi:putative transcriptional regulator
MAKKAPATAKKKVKSRLNRIKEALLASGKSQYWLRNETGITDVSISGYVNGTIEPSLNNLFRIAEALKVNPKDLINS